MLANKFCTARSWHKFDFNFFLFFFLVKRKKRDDAKRALSIWPEIRYRQPWGLNSPMERCETERCTLCFQLFPPGSTYWFKILLTNRRSSSSKSMQEASNIKGLEKLKLNSERQCENWWSHQMNMFYDILLWKEVHSRLKTSQLKDWKLIVWSN